MPEKSIGVSDSRKILSLGCITQAVDFLHYGDVIMSTMASQITGVSMVCSTVCSGAWPFFWVWEVHWSAWFQENSWSPGSALGVHDFSTKSEKCFGVRDLGEILEVFGVRWECVISWTKSEKCVGSAWFQENAWSPRSALEVHSALLLRWECIGSAWKCVGVRYQWQECVKSAHSNALLFSKGSLFHVPNGFAY